MSKPLSGLGKGSVSSFSGRDAASIWTFLLIASVLLSTAQQRFVLLPACVLLGQVDVMRVWRRVLVP